jgi:hypothetical protein
MRERKKYIVTLPFREKLTYDNVKKFLRAEQNKTCAIAYPRMVMQLWQFVVYMKNRKNFMPILPCEKQMQDRPT